MYIRVTERHLPNVKAVAQGSNPNHNRGIQNAWTSENSILNTQADTEIKHGWEKVETVWRKQPVDRRYGQNEGPNKWKPLPGKK